jgi:hypothetical protein
VLDWLFSDHHRRQIRAINGRTRRCASQEGNAVFAQLSLGLADGRVDELARCLVSWQWPDGGWNCDKNPAASVSSFHETLIPLRALALHAQRTGSATSRLAAERAAEIFLKRGLFRRMTDGSVMDGAFLKLHYPSYWHYDVLAGLKVLAEAGFVKDPRCAEALDWLESRQLPGGGFPADGKFYRIADTLEKSNISLVDWDPARKQVMNAFVTADALFVLRAAGRYRPPLFTEDSHNTGNI